MAELDIKPNFGIENTMDIGSLGNTELLNDLFAPETSTADPDNISSIEEESKNVKTEDVKKPLTDDVPEDKAKDPVALTNFLLNDEEDDEKEEVEEKEKVPTNEIKKDDDDDDEPISDSSIAFDSLANELADLGVFSRMEGEEDGIKITTPEEFLERFKTEKTQAANQMIGDFIGQFGDDYQQAFQAIYIKGVSPKEYFTQQAKIEDFSNMDLTLESNQERVVREVLGDQGFDQNDIDAEINKLKNYGDLEDVSKRHHKVLVKKEQQVLASKAKEAEELNQFKRVQKQKYYENVSNILKEKIAEKEFDGIPINIQSANELQDFLLVDKWKTESGETLTDFDKTILDLKRPENHEQKVKIALLLKLLEKDPTLSTIQKRGVSKKSSQLFKDVARQKTTSIRTDETKTQPAKSWFQK